MKRILAITFILSSMSTLALAAPLASGTVTGTGVAIYGGVDAASALNATNGLVRTSTGVRAIVNTDTGHTEYALGTKHDTGNKIFGTANDSTNIYWFQSIAGNTLGANFGTGTNKDNFGGAGWTAY